MVRSCRPSIYIYPTITKAALKRMKQYLEEDLRGVRP